MKSTRYQFGILLNGNYLYPWQIKVIEALYKTGLAECSLLIIKKSNSSPDKSLFKKLFNPNLLFEFAKKLRLHSGPYKQIPIPSWLNTEILYAEVSQEGKYAEIFSSDDVNAIKSKNLDFLIRFGFGIIKGEILESAKWGIWSFHHGNEQEFRGGPAGYWEIIKNADKQGVLLQQLTDKLDSGKLILKREFSVLRHSYSENLNKLFLQSADMPAQALKMIHSGNLNPESFNPISTHAPIYRYPSNLQFIKGWFIISFYRLKLKWVHLCKQEKWVIGWRQQGNHQYQFISSPSSGTYYADPFIILENGITQILAEYYSYKEKKGSIVLIKPNQSGHTTIIEKDTHLSYPFIFHEKGITYIIPEEANTGKLNLYQWDGQTESVKFITTLLNQPAIDASIVKHQDTYYLFAGLKGELPNEKLFLYYSSNLFGPYQEHPCNPVKVSPEGARMAGAFLHENGNLVRPSQCSIHAYGEKVIFQKILELSKTSYKEEPFKELTPGMLKGFSDGLHTFHKSGNFVVIDVKRMQSDWVSFNAQLK